MRVVRTTETGSREELVIPSADRTPQGYEATAITYPADGIYLATDKGERRRSGSYYTPDHIVDYIVQKTLGARCNEVFRQLQAEIDAKKQALETAPGDQRALLLTEVEQLQGSFDDRILQLKVLDPAMGSGHFLIGACHYLAEEIATNPFTSHSGAHLTGDGSTITYWKRRVAESCLHGVDVNPMAVELAKLALWLDTVAADAPLTFLDHHLRHGDSIIGARISGLDSLPGDEGSLFEEQFGREVAAALPSLLEPLKEIDTIPSDKAEHVKQKEEIYRRRFLPALKRFAAVGDLWSSEAIEALTIRSEQYAKALGLLGAPRKFDDVVKEDWATAALRLLNTKEVSPFHWELAYPHVFLPNRSGSDVVLGNPPYDVLSEREIGKNIDHLKRFIQLDPTLDPSRIGKNNLYKIFVLRSLELLAEDGYLSFIVPMPLLGDEQANGIRRALFSAGGFLESHAFPQKDNPARRVFRDAKLATALFVFQKLRQDLRSDRPFRSQVHPAQFIEPSSLSVMLDSNSIKLYDPENLTIVSCSQEDWNLVRSVAEQPIARLGKFVRFFQGEVNQTVATSRGFLTDSEHGLLVTRGANISLYQLRQASQGEDIYLNVRAFLDGKSADTKAFHHRLERVGLQESSPQNNFRRTIACRIPIGNFCNHKINYTTSRHSEIPLELVLFVLNSSFADWYFRLGSTNAAVSHYQLTNIPCPYFGKQEGTIDAGFCKEIDTLVEAKNFHAVEKECIRFATIKGCDPSLERVIVSLIKFIEEEERRRGQISRSARSRLAEEAEKCQVVLDKVMMVLLGLADETHEYISSRLKEML
jgi:hypothetical protein